MGWLVGVQARWGLGGRNSLTLKFGVVGRGGTTMRKNGVRKKHYWMSETNTIRKSGEITRIHPGEGFFRTQNIRINIKTGIERVGKLSKTTKYKGEEGGLAGSRTILQHGEKRDRGRITPILGGNGKGMRERGTGWGFQILPKGTPLGGTKVLSKTPTERKGKGKMSKGGGSGGFSARGWGSALDTQLTRSCISKVGGGIDLVRD